MVSFDGQAAASFGQLCRKPIGQVALLPLKEGAGDEAAMADAAGVDERQKALRDATVEAQGRYQKLGNGRGLQQRD
jgi:hypothetical protein